MTTKLVIQFAAVSVASMFLAFLSYQLMDLKRELKRYSPVNPCTGIHPKLDPTMYRYYRCANREISIHLVNRDTKTETMGRSSETSLYLKADNSTKEQIKKKLNIRPRKKVLPDDFIKSKICRKKIPILIVVSSYYSHLVRRTSIRSTWGSDGSMTPNWNTLFVLAQGRNATIMEQARREQKIFKDIIISNFRESFYNLSYKVELGLMWSLHRCQFDYLLKADDDVFVNVPNLMEFLKRKSTPKTGLYSGNVNYISPVLRKGRYGVSEREYSKQFYPRYCSGGGFVLSRDVVSKIVDRIALSPNRSRLKIDDAYVGELVLESGVDVFPSDDFLMFESKCIYKPHAIVHHPVKEFYCMRNLYMTSTAVAATTVPPKNISTTNMG